MNVTLSGRSSQLPKTWRNQACCCHDHPQEAELRESTHKNCSRHEVRSAVRVPVRPFPIQRIALWSPNEASWKMLFRNDLHLRFIVQNARIEALTVAGQWGDTNSLPFG